MTYIAKSCTRRLTIYINDKEGEASSNRHLRRAYPQPKRQKLHLEAGEGVGGKASQLARLSRLVASVMASICRWADCGLAFQAVDSRQTADREACMSGS